MFWGEKQTNIISHKALKQDIRCTCTERDETKAFKRVSQQNEFVSAKFHISIIKALLLPWLVCIFPVVKHPSPPLLDVIDVDNISIIILSDTSVQVFD